MLEYLKKVKTKKKKKKNLALAWWHTPAILIFGRKRTREPQVQSQFQLHSEILF